MNVVALPFEQASSRELQRAAGTAATRFPLTASCPSTSCTSPSTGATNARIGRVSAQSAGRRDALIPLYEQTTPPAGVIMRAL